MIEPQVHTNQRGIIGQQHGLQKLTETLEALSTGQKQQQQRATQLQTQLTTQAQQLAGLVATSKRLMLAIGTLGALTLASVGLTGWQWLRPPVDVGFVRALGAVDQALVQQWTAMPRGPQEALIATYNRLGLSPHPGERQRK